MTLNMQASIKQEQVCVCVCGGGAVKSVRGAVAKAVAKAVQGRELHSCVPSHV